MRDMLILHSCGHDGLFIEYYCPKQVWKIITTVELGTGSPTESFGIETNQVYLMSCEMQKYGCICI